MAGKQDPSLAFLLSYSVQETKARVICHIGSDMECQYKLKHFGIPMHCRFPVDSDGNFNLDYHKQWMQQRRDEERGVGNSNLPFLNPPVKTGLKDNEVQSMCAEHLVACISPSRGEAGIDRMAVKS
jgi:hypothetical protein